MGMAGNIIDFIEGLIYAIAVVAIAGIFLWEPIQTFWTKHTWRETNGLFVRDYSLLRAWARTALAKAFRFLLIILALVLLYLVL